MHASLIIAGIEHRSLIETFVSSISPHEREDFTGDLHQDCLNSAKAGFLFIVLSGDKIVAMSSLSPLNPTLVETRTCFVAPEYRGFGLQRLMHEARAIVIRRRWGKNCVAVAAVKRTAVIAVQNLLTLGFISWNDPLPAVYDAYADCFHQSKAPECCCNFFLCDREKLAALATSMRRSAMRKLTDSGGRVFVVDCSSIVMQSPLSLAPCDFDRGNDGPPPAVFWLTGISGAGKTTVAGSMQQLFWRYGWRLCILDGDDLRAGLNVNLGFTETDRAENVRRIAEVAALMADAGLLVVASCISPKTSFRDSARRAVGHSRFIEVHIDTPLPVAEERDPKGLYKLARKGKIQNFTGLHSSYEAPHSPEIHIDTTALSSTDAAAAICRYYILNHVGGNDLTD